MVSNLITCNGKPLIHINTVFTYINVQDLKSRDILTDKKFEEELYKSIKEKGILDPLLVWFLTGVPNGPKSGYLVRVGSSRLHICKEYPELGIKKMPCFVLNYQGTFKPTARNKGYNLPLAEGELINSKEGALLHCYNKDIQLRFSEKGWLVYAVAMKFLKNLEKY